MFCRACSTENAVGAPRCRRCGVLLPVHSVNVSHRGSGESASPSGEGSFAAASILPAARAYSLIDSLSMAPDGSIRAQVDEDRVLFYRPAAGNNDIYRLQGVLGQGGLGVVFLGTDTRTGHLVAVKRPVFAPGTRRHHVEDLMQEGMSAARVRHPNVVRIVDCGIDHEGPYLVTELIDGPDLSRVIKESGALEERRVFRIMLALCHAVGAAHAAGLMHRDIKPSNVVQDAQDRPHVLDFGLARSMLEIRVDEAGRFLGTPGYIAPEQARNASRADHRADIYSLGVTCYVMLSGHAPQPLDFAKVPEQWRMLLSRATHSDPDVRHANCAELMRDVLSVALPATGQCICCAAPLDERNGCPSCGANLGFACPACGQITRLDRPECASCRRSVRRSATLACSQSFAKALLASGHIDEAETVWQQASDIGEPDPGPCLSPLSAWQLEQHWLQDRARRADLAYQEALRTESTQGPFAAIAAYHRAALLDRRLHGAYLNCLALVNPAALPVEGEAPISDRDLQDAIYKGDEVTANRYYRERERQVQLAVAAGNTDGAAILPEIDKQRQKIAARWRTRTLLFFIALVVFYGGYLLLGIFG